MKSTFPAFFVAALLILPLPSPSRGATTLSIRPAVELQFEAQAPNGYQLQASDNLATWSDVAASVVGRTGLVSRLLPAREAAKFYRLEAFNIRPLDAILEGIRSTRNAPALACAVIQSNRLVGVGVSGFRKQGVSERVTLTDKWHHGSLTKSMTATLAALLVDDGRITWATKLVDVFPEKATAMNPSWTTVTLEQLLANRGGAPEDLGPGGIWTQIWNFQGSPREARLFLLDKVTARAPRFTPGTAYEYSNAGFAMAGAMLERVMDRPWEDLLTERLFQPLGMDSAGFGVPATPRHVDQPWGHTLSGAVFTPMPPGTEADNPPAIGPAGTVHASLLDMASYAAFHLRGARGEGELLQPATFAKLYEDVAGQGYGLGWNVLSRPWAGGKALQHNGSNLQWFTNIWIAPGRNWAVVVLTNFGSPGASADFQLTDAVVARMIQEFL